MNNVKKYLLSGIILLLLIPKIACAEYAPPDPNVCNRGIDSTARAGEIYNFSSNAICRYDISAFSNEGWYILQIDGEYKIELSTDRINWTTELTSSGWNYWTNKGPAKSMSPYYIDLKPYLPENVLYVKISDNTPANGNGARVLNALLLERCYPNFYAGGAEPFQDALCGDQNYLFEKNNTSDSIDQGRVADNNNYFVYKFDLPNNNDKCKLFVNVSGEYKISISTNYDFSTVLYSSQNPAGDTSQRLLRIDLESILAQSADNVLYFKMSDSDPTDAGGGNLKELWITPQVLADNLIFHPYDEIESAFIWENNGSRMASGNTRYTDLSYFFVYRFNFAYENSSIKIDTAGEYLFQGSSNGVDWVDLFIGPSDNTQAQAETLIFNPFTGEAIGQGAQSGIPSLTAKSYDGWDNVFFLRASDVDSSDGWGAQMKSITVTPPKTVLCSFDYAHTVSELSVQPRPDDLTQMPGSENILIAGAMHVAWADNQFAYMFNSPSVGDNGVGSPNSPDITGRHGVLLADSQSMVIHCNFDSPKSIEEINIFAGAEDTRLFNDCEIYFSKTGTSDSNYQRYIIPGSTNLGFGNWGDSAAPYKFYNSVARVYTTTGEPLETSVTSVKLVLTLCCDLPNDMKKQNVGGSSVINEIDIIGIPEPVTIYYLSFIIYNLLKRK